MAPTYRILSRNENNGSPAEGAGVHRRKMFEWRRLASAACLVLLACVQGSYGQAPTGNWSASVTLDSGNVMTQPAISGPADVATAVWTSGQSSATSLKVAQKTSGVNLWQVAAMAEGGITLPPVVAESSDGTAIAGMSAVGYPTVSTRNGFNASWGPQVTLSSGGVYLWRLFLDGQDNAVALTSDNCPSTCSTYVADRPYGGSWTTKLINGNGTTYGAISALNASGMMAAVFVGVQGSALNITVRTRTSSTGAWTAAQQLWSGTGTVTPQVAVAIDVNGLVTVAWNVYANGGYTSLEASQGQAGSSTWSAPVILDSVASGYNVQSPVVAAVPVTGDVVAAWSRRTTVSAIETSYLSRGGSWSAPVAVNTPSANSAGKPSLAASPDGSLVALTWVSSFSKTAAAFNAAVENPATHQWTPPALLSTTGDLSSQPVVTCGPSGTATAVWLGTKHYSVVAATYK